MSLILAVEQSLIGYSSGARISAAPVNAMLAEDETAILAEDGSYILEE